MIHWAYINRNNFVLKKGVGTPIPMFRRSTLEPKELDEETFNSIEIGDQLTSDGHVVVRGELSNDEKIESLRTKLRETNEIVLDLFEDQLENQQSLFNLNDIHNAREKWRTEIRSLSKEKSE